MLFPASSVPLELDGGHYGIALCVVGDVDGDHVADFAVAETSGNSRHPCVDLRSGVDGKLLWRIDVPRADANGLHLAAAGDIDRDGVPDVLCSLPWLTDPTGLEGTVQVFSGIDGHVVLTVRDKRSGTLFGQSLAGNVDFDLDGTPDFAVGAPPGYDKDPLDGHIVVCSGRDGRVLLDVGRPSSAATGWLIAAGHDFDGDGIPDIVSDAAGSRADWVILSGGTGALIQSMFHPHREPRGMGCVDLARSTVFASYVDSTDPPHGGGFVDQFTSGCFEAERTHAFEDKASLFGTACTARSDLDGDGVLDVVVSARESQKGGWFSGEVRAWSGADGHVLWSLPGTEEADLGASLASGLDVDDDGCGDVLAGAVWMNGSGHPGRVWVISGKTGRVIRKITRSSR